MTIINDISNKPSPKVIWEKRVAIPTLENALSHCVCQLEGVLYWNVGMSVSVDFRSNRQTKAAQQREQRKGGRQWSIRCDLSPGERPTVYIHSRSNEQPIFTL